MEITVVGTGRMGSAFVKRAAALGHKVYAWNRTREKLSGLPATAIEGLSDARGLVAIFVADDEALMGIVEQIGGEAAALMGTYSVNGAVEAVRRLRSRGIPAFASPIVGGPGNVERGDAIYLLGGERTLLDKYTSVMFSLGKVVLVGELEKAVALKLAYNSLLIGTVAVLGEALSLAVAYGIPATVFKDLLSQTVFKEIGSVYIDRMLSEGEGTFALKHAGKDLRYAVNASAGKSGAVVLSAVHSLYELLELQGYGNEYYIKAGILENKHKK
ncbi:NAD(P)-dependent oxidoreductase [Thermoproteus tenax]|uniref:3-hydroxyisobutyrate dehydrogenase n=1 Tax=Thermoproteus tenax (strain ATCC 35583 / DSM 2078 / JCM 9277 / NBRC 100435 / Kra 1) TaxID=768679 RepID=G4RQ01_THETK|nr:NAD(P)-binding domain-containing protein [Thermoproteus tenax]CCC81647.1 3-hydroxyisobutyrate dehydrogenase [Thermoproteus tenax Kra 1]